MKRNTPRHPKMRVLAKALGIPRYGAVGILEMLWHATAQLCPRGDIGRLEDDHIAEECCWDGEPAVLIDALVRSGWVDLDTEHRLVIHDWQDHAQQSVQRTKTVREQGFVSPCPQTSDQLAVDGQNDSLPWTLNHEPRTLNHEPPAGQPADSAADAAVSVGGKGNGRPGGRKPRLTAFPEPFPAELRAQLDRWATDRGFSPPQVKSAIEAVADWAISNGKRKADWARTIQGAMRNGWALPRAGESDEQRYARIQRELEQEKTDGLF